MHYKITEHLFFHMIITSINILIINKIFFFKKKIMLPKLSLLLIVVAFLNLSLLTNSQCVHDHFAHKVKHHYYNDLEEQRLLT